MHIGNDQVPAWTQHASELSQNRFKAGYVLVQSLLLASLPAIIVWGLLSARLARSAVSDLVMELQRPQPPGKLQESLARAIGDPSLTLAYARDRQDGWVDLSGQEVALPLPGIRSRH
jgi:hypothetical protein